MAVANLITPVDPAGVFPSIPAGLDRLLFITVTAIQGASINAVAASAVTVGGVSASWAAGDTPGSSRLRAASNTWVIKESQISGIASGNAIIVTGATGSVVRQIAAGLQGCNQGDISRIANGYVGSGAITMSLARAADSWTFFFAAVVIAEDITLTNPSRTSRLFNVNIGYAADTARTANSTTQSKTYIQNAHVINIEPAPLQKIISVNDGNGVKIGSTGNIAKTTAFTSVTGGTFGGKQIVVTGFNVATGDVTFNAPSVVDMEPFPPFNSNQTLVLTNGSTETTSLTGITMSPPDGSTLITVSSPENIDPKALGKWIIDVYGFAPVNGDTGYGIDSQVLWQPNLYGSAPSLPVTTPFIYRRTSTGIAYSMMVTINPEGDIIDVVGGIDARPIKVRGIKSRGIQCRGLK